MGVTEFRDAKKIIKLTKNNGLILIGSSMGGWISLLLSRELGSRLKGLITIAAAPDFTEDSMWKNFTEDQKKEVLNKELLMVTRFSKLPSNYSGYINAGTKTAENVISFELSGNKILLKRKILGSI